MAAVAVKEDRAVASSRLRISVMRISLWDGTSRPPGAAGSTSGQIDNQAQGGAFRITV
jgi:hypothetical protein